MSLAALGAAPRDRNLPFRYAEVHLPGIGPGPLVQSVRRAMSEFRSDGKKDGASLSDPERLYLMVQAMTESGANGQAIEDAVSAVFFDRGGPNSGRDYVKDVSYSPGQPIRISFRHSGGYSFDQGGILPMIVSPPAAFPGLDTNRRGNAVQSFQDGTIARQGSWLETEEEAIIQGFLSSDAGADFDPADLETLRQDPEFRAALWTFEKDLGNSYLIQAPAWIQAQVGDTSGMSEQQVIDSAVLWACQYANPNLFAVAHPGLVQLQDEAAAQLALLKMGITANIDTDRY